MQTKGEIVGATDERKFLHDLANPLSVVQGNAKIALRKLEQLQMKGEPFSPQEFRERLVKIIGACDKLAASVTDRRTQLQAEEQGSAR
jgi:signal transduction histidine kinase